MFTVCFLCVVFIAQECTSQDSEGPYKGRYIGDLNTYANQVAGEVYAVDEWTLLMVNFFYNGEGRDTYFWAGENGRSSPQGFIVPDEYGKTNILERYNGTNSFTLTLPGGKRISRLKWLAVFDIDTQNVYGDVYIPADFEAPAPRAVGGLAGSRAVVSRPLTFLDSKTLLIRGFSYDGSGGEVYFWTGVGPQPSPRGQRIPDEHGYLEPLRVYDNEEVTLVLPGDLDVFHINWISIYDVAANRSLASASVPDQLNVPASLLSLHAYKSTLPQCRQLHRQYQVSWEVFGNQITIQLAAQLRDNEYMAFGISGSREKSVMLGADVAVAWFDKKQERPMVTDYNITDLAPCVQVLGQWRGVCRDERLGQLDSYQVISGQRDNGLTTITYRRTLQPAEEFDREFPLDRPLLAVWALGALDDAAEPSFHRAYNKHDLKLDLGQAEPSSNCFPFTTGAGAVEQTSPWDVAALTDPGLRVFHFRVGPAGGPRGLAGRGARGGAAPALAWYVNGQLAPDLQIRRGLQYTFKVYGGNDPHSATEYHPLVVTDEPVGGLERLGAAAQGRVRAFAGVHLTRRAKLSPTTAGGLCLAAPTRDRRRDGEFDSFRTYNRSLRWECGDVAPADLPIAPNSSWPDLVYYNSFTHPGMGGRIFVVDRFRRDLGKPNSAPLAAVASLALLAPLACIFALALQ